jgi:hypothetical protein
MNAPRAGGRKGSTVYMRLAVFPPEERVSDVPENVVRDGLLASLKAMSGFQGAYFCIDPISGKGLSVTLWETEKALRDSEEYIGRMSQADETLIPNPSIVETFEVRYLA